MALQTIEEAQVFDPTDKTWGFIDGDNLFSALRKSRLDFDQNGFRNALQQNTRLRSLQLFHSVPQDQGRDRIVRFLDSMDAAGYVTVRKSQEPVWDYDSGQVVGWTGDMDGEIFEAAVDIRDFADTVVLVTHDADFVPLVRILQRRGVRVVIIGVEGRIARGLRTQADLFLQLDRYAELVKPKPAPPPRGNGERSDKAIAQSA